MAEVWHWAPNSLTETLEFKTDLRNSRSAERRDSYCEAIQKLSFGHVVSPEVAEQMFARLLVDPNQTHLVPEWPTATISPDTSISITDTVIPVEDDVVYAVGQKVFFGAGDAWEVGEVDSLGGSSITLTAGSSAGYTGSPQEPFFVAPLILSILPDGIQYSARYPIRGVTMQFLSVEPVDISESPASTYDGLPLVLDGMVSISELSGSVGRSSILASSGFGVFDIIESETFNRRRSTLSFLDTSYAERLARRRFFHFMNGRSGEMWTPSGQPDVSLNSSFGSSSLTIDVKPIGPASYMVGKTIIISEGANSVVREITGAVDNSATSQSLEISATGFNGTVDAQISLLTRCRFDTDTFDLSYGFSQDGLIARSSMPTVEVP